MADSSKAESAHCHSAPSTCHFLQVWVKSLRIARALSEKSRLDSKDVADSVICRHECDEAFCRPERSEVSHHIKSSKDSSFALQTENDKSIESNKDALYATNMRTIVKDFAKTCKHDKVDSINTTRCAVMVRADNRIYIDSKGGFYVA